MYLKMVDAGLPEIADAPAIAPARALRALRGGGAIRAELTRIARLLVMRARERIGLWPAAAHVAVSSVALQLGAALAGFTGRSVAVVGARTEEAGSLAPRLRRVLDRTSSQGSFARVLIDLTGFDLSGEHLDALDLIDAAIIVGRAGRTTEQQLLQASFQLPAEKTLGVVLVG